MPLTIDRADVAALTARASALSAAGRALLGITGPPGAGKSTLAAELVAALGPAAVLVPMDGFHLAQSELKRLGRHDRKGAVDTFDAAGFVALVRRLRAGDEDVYAPTFRRDLEEPVAGAINVAANVPLVVLEGNYLLVADPPWQSLRELFDEVWYVELDREARIERLVARHVAFGRDPVVARAWALGSDERNAELIAATRDRADVVVIG
ncbi:MAG TPA: nucleoside/nucleotide kinase family protein [Acidothermaceae bacterium]